MKQLLSLLILSGVLTGCGGGEESGSEAASGNVILEISPSKSVVDIGEPLELVLSLNNLTSTSKTVSFSFNGPGGLVEASQARFSGACVTNSLFFDQLVIKAEVIVPARTNGSCTFTVTKRFNEASEPEFVAFNLQNPNNVEFSQPLPRITVKY